MGQKRAEIDLGGAFHRSRIRLISSQVSTISPELSGRWDKSRRFEVAWQALERIKPEKWITHRFFRTMQKKHTNCWMKSAGDDTGGIQL
jgi:hypothetical protein